MMCFKNNHSDFSAGLFTSEQHGILANPKVSPNIAGRPQRRSPVRSCLMMNFTDSASQGQPASYMKVLVGKFVGHTTFWFFIHAAQFSGERLSNGAVFIAGSYSC